MKGNKYIEKGEKNKTNLHLELLFSQVLTLSLKMVTLGPPFLV